MGTLTIRLDDELDKELARLAKRQKRTKSELVRDMLRKHMLLEEFDRLRAELMPYAEKAGWLTDEDVFRDIS